MTTKERIGQHGASSDFFPTNLGDYEVYVEAADGTSGIPDEGPFRHGHIVVRKGTSASGVICLGSAISTHNRFWTVPFWQGEDLLISLWKDVTVPVCVKNAVERIHSQHRRLAI